MQNKLLGINSASKGEKLSDYKDIICYDALKSMLLPPIAVWV